MASDLAVQRLLAASMSDLGSDPICRGDLIRRWVLDLGWLSRSESELAMTSLIEAEWLIEEADNVRIAVVTRGVTAPPGWQPDLSSILDCSPPLLPSKSVLEENSIVNRRPDEKSMTRSADEINVDVDFQLMQHISLSAGISLREVARRARRKRSALGPATSWICLLLVACEQAIDLDPIYASFPSFLD